MASDESNGPMDFSSNGCEPTTFEPQMSNGSVQGMDTTNGEPFLLITEQPQPRGFRFRYHSEGTSHGGIQGIRSTKGAGKTKSYPSVAIMNYKGPARIVVSLVTDEDIPKVHAHELVGGPNCKNGLYVMELRGDTNMTVTFPHLSILHATKRNMIKILESRILESMRLRSLLTTMTGSIQQEFQLSEEDHEKARQQAQEQAKAMKNKMSAVRLCFQAYLMDDGGTYSRVLPSVTSDAIYDSKASTGSSLKICRMDRQSGTCEGGDEVFLLCDKVHKDDIKVRFFQEDTNGELCWEGFGEFGPYDIHRQYAIVFRTPSYGNTDLSREVVVQLELHRPSDGEYSDPKPFTYYPKQISKDGVEKKRKKPLPFNLGGSGDMDGDVGTCSSSGGDRGAEGSNTNSSKKGGNRNYSGSSRRGHKTSNTPRQESSTFLKKEDNDLVEDCCVELSNTRHTFNNNVHLQPTKRLTAQPLNSGHLTKVQPPSYSYVHVHQPVKLQEAPSCMSGNIVQQPLGGAMNSAVLQLQSTQSGFVMPQKLPTVSVNTIPSIAPSINRTKIFSQSLGEPALSGTRHVVHQTNRLTQSVPVIGSGQCDNLQRVPYQTATSRPNPVQQLPFNENTHNIPNTSGVKTLMQLPANGPSDYSYQRTRGHAGNSLNQRKTFEQHTLHQPFATAQYTSSSTIPQPTGLYSQASSYGFVPSQPPFANVNALNTRSPYDSTYPSDNDDVTKNVSGSTSWQTSSFDIDEWLVSLCAAPDDTLKPKGPKDQEPQFNSQLSYLNIALRIAEHTAETLQEYAETGDITAVLYSQRHLVAVQDENGDTMLHLAIKYHHMEAVRNLVTVAKTLPLWTKLVNQYNDLRQTCLHLAVLTGQSALVDLLIKTGADPTLPDRHGNTPIHLATMATDDTILEILLSSHVSNQSLDVLNHKGQAAVHLATRRSSTECVRLLYSAGADMDLCENSSGRTPLHIAVENKDLSITGLLILEASVDIDAPTYNGDTPLHYACSLQLPGLVSLLMAAGADSGATNYECKENSEEGQTPCDLAGDNEQIARILQGDPQSTCTNECSKVEEWEVESVKIVKSNINTDTGDLRLLDAMTRQRIGHLLDPADNGRDWMALAEVMGLGCLVKIFSMCSQKDTVGPTQLLLNSYEVYDGTVQQLCNLLVEIGRPEVVDIIQENTGSKVNIEERVRSKVMKTNLKHLQVMKLEEGDDQQQDAIESGIASMTIST